MASTLVPLFGPVPGGMEMVVILLIAVLLFGANKIPKLARSTGQAMGEFQKGRQQVEQELEEMEETMEPDADLEDGSKDDTEYMDLDDEEADEEFDVDSEKK
ncbi:Sec-independent protein translocase subunit TatA/TatB [Halobacteriaceae archaeon SHR40]|uniref:twin-arginine translocase TatA/TatE family subunit n=1 Tax=Halovenus amylolytica TaxID=2500550 RepID=UPI000FE2AAF5